MTDSATSRPETVIVPRFRDPSAGYVFVMDDAGSIARVLYPADIVAKLHRSEAD